LLGQQLLGQLLGYGGLLELLRQLLRKLLRQLLRLGDLFKLLRSEHELVLRFCLQRQFWWQEAQAPQEGERLHRFDLLGLGDQLLRLQLPRLDDDELQWLVLGWFGDVLWRFGHQLRRFGHQR